MCYQCSKNIEKCAAWQEQKKSLVAEQAPSKQALVRQEIGCAIQAMTDISTKAQQMCAELIAEAPQASTPSVGLQQVVSEFHEKIGEIKQSTMNSVVQLQQQIVPVPQSTTVNDHQITNGT